LVQPHSHLLLRIMKLVVGVAMLVAHAQSSSNITVNGSGDDMQDVLLEGLSDSFLSCAVAIADEGLSAEDCAETVIKFIGTAAVAIIGWVTHNRRIIVGVSPVGPSKQFHRWYTQAHDGVQFGVSDAQPGNGVTTTFHNDGPISGCVAYYQDCGWDLYVAASNPLVGHNKVRVAYAKRGSNGNRGCYEIWDDMDSWAEHEGSAHPMGNWQYDNPSLIHYYLDIPAECEQTFKIKHSESGKYLTISSIEDGTQVTLTEDNSGHQLWKMRSNGQIYNTVGGKCLDPDGNAQKSTMIIWGCWSDTHQGWKVDNNAFGNFAGFLRNKESGLCIDPVGQMYGCWSVEHQGYEFVIQNTQELHNNATILI